MIGFTSLPGRNGVTQSGSVRPFNELSSGTCFLSCPGCPKNSSVINLEHGKITNDRLEHVWFVIQIPRVEAWTPPAPCLKMNGEYESDQWWFRQGIFAVAFPTFSEIHGETMGKPCLTISFPWFPHQFPWLSRWAKLQIAQGHQASQEMHLAPGDEIVPGATSWVQGA